MMRRTPNVWILRACRTGFLVAGLAVASAVRADEAPADSTAVTPVSSSSAAAVRQYGAPLSTTRKVKLDRADRNVVRTGPTLVFDFGEWRSPVASRKNPDGSISFMTTAIGVYGYEFVVGSAGGKRTLVLRDAQHEYAFTER